MRLLTLPCLIVLAVAAPVAAQTTINRCVGTRGNPVFTDQPCAALGATPVSSATPLRAAPEQGQPPGLLCAATPAVLQQAVVDAFASQSANQLAGLMLWDGYGQEAVIAAIGDLETAMRQPLLDIHAGGAVSSSASIAPEADMTAPLSAPAGPGAFGPVPSPDEGGLVLHTAGNDGSGRPREMRFDMVRRAGCLWLRSNN